LGFVRIFLVFSPNFPRQSLKESIHFYNLNFRDSLSAQLELTLTKAHSEQLARSIAEEQVSEMAKQTEKLRYKPKSGEIRLLNGKRCPFLLLLLL